MALSDPKIAFEWIVGILNKHQVPFQIAGGLAARAYGATRPLNDIDIDMPEDCFQDILDDVRPYVDFGPAHYKDERWNQAVALKLTYQGQDIDLGGSNELSICDARTGEWKQISAVDFQKSESREIFGMRVPVIPKDELIAYKSMLAGAHQKRDIEEMK